MSSTDGPGSCTGRRASYPLHGCSHAALERAARSVRGVIRRTNDRGILFAAHRGHAIADAPTAEPGYLTATKVCQDSRSKRISIHSAHFPGSISRSQRVVMSPGPAAMLSQLRTPWPCSNNAPSLCGMRLICPGLSLLSKACICQPPELRIAPTNQFRHKGALVAYQYVDIMNDPVA